MEVLDHATSEIALPREIERWGKSAQIAQDYLMGRGSKPGIDATKKLADEGFKPDWRSGRWLRGIPAVVPQALH